MKAYKSIRHLCYNSVRNIFKKTFLPKQRLGKSFASTILYIDDKDDIGVYALYAVEGQLMHTNHHSLRFYTKFGLIGTSPIIIPSVV